MKTLFISIFFISQTFAYEIKNINLPRFEDDRQEQVDFSKTDNTIVLNFWASWCTSCIEELPLLHGLQKSKASNIKFYAISAGDTKKKIKKFTKKNPFHYEILMDKHKSYSKSVGISSLPVTLIIRKGQIVYEGHRPPARIDE